MSKSTPPKEQETNQRYTMFSRPSSIYKLDYISSMDFINKGAKTTRTDLVNKAIEEFIERWEKKNGEIPNNK